MPILRKYGFTLAVFVLLALMAVYLITTYWGGSGQKLDVLGTAPEFELTDIDGSTVKRSDSDGKVRLYYFFFANCPDVCPPTTSMAKEVQEDLIASGDFPNNVEFSWITIDPERDTLEAMADYAARFNIDTNGWHFLRGEPKQVVEIGEGFNLGIRNEGGPENLIHMDLLVLVDREGQIRKYIRGSGEETMTPEQILADVRSVLKE